MTYVKQVATGLWEFISFRAKCPICHLPNCAVKNGHYKRSGYDKFFKLVEILVQRYLCRTNQRLGKTPLTFSVLPDCLIPYCKYSIKIMSYCLSEWLKYSQDMPETVKNIFTKIEGIGNELFNLEGPQIATFIKLFEGALTKYKIWKRIDTTYSLERFIEYCSRNKYQQAEITGLEYYEGNGNHIKNSQFLFGKASQFR